MCFKFSPQDDQGRAASLSFVTPDCPAQAKACAIRRDAWVEPARPVPAEQPATLQPATP